MKLGIDRFINEKKIREEYVGKKIALLGQPASVLSDLTHSADALSKCLDIKLTALFGPQHGMRGDKQDNMIESEDYLDEQLQLPVFSLYGKTRKPTKAMMSSFDVLLVDMQDVGCRIYTFVTTLRYMLEACTEHGKTIVILDRPNPAGRPIEGTLLQDGFESFVGPGFLPIRHGMTMAEIAKYFVSVLKLNVDLDIVEMENYKIDQAPGFGWPPSDLTWVNPSPNAASLSMTRCFAGTVLLEGTNISEGRGTTIPLEMFAAPDFSSKNILEEMNRIAPKWLLGCKLRPCFVEPTFQKHKGKLCEGFQIHVDTPFYDPEKFKPYRLIAVALRAVKNLYPKFKIWRDFHYEYENDRLAIDLINGGPLLRQWVDDPESTVEAFEETLQADEKKWLKIREPFLLY